MNVGDFVTYNRPENEQLHGMIGKIVNISDSHYKILWDPTTQDVPYATWESWSQIAEEEPCEIPL